MRVHEWCHEVFRVLNAKVPVEICIFTRRDLAFRCGIYTNFGTWHFTRDGIVTFTRDIVVLTKLNNRQDSSCL